MEEAAHIADLDADLPDSVEEVTADWMTSVLRASGAIAAGTTVSGIDSRPLDTREDIGGGLLSLLHRCVLRYEGGTGPASVVVKFPIDTPNTRALVEAFRVYVREVTFYRDVAARSQLRTPQVHAALIDPGGSRFCMVIEDLGHLRQVSSYQGLGWDDALVAIEALAAFHAGWHGSAELGALAEVFLPWTDPVYRFGMPQLFEAAWPAAKRHGGDVLPSDVERLGDGGGALLPAMIDRLSGTPTLCHGDWKPDNFFFDPKGEVTVIDAQISCVMNGAFDVGYFVSQGLQSQVRSGRGEELVRRYVDAMATHGVVLDAEEFLSDTRVAVALCLVYGFSLFAGFEQMRPGEQASARSLLQRCAAGCVEFGALAAVERLT